MTEATATNAGTAHTILLASDGSQSARPAEGVAAALATALRAKVALVSVLEFEPWRDLDYQVNQLYLDDRRREIRGQLQETAQRLQAQGVTVETHNPVGLPSQEILALASSLRSDLVVVGTHGRAGLDHVLIGSTAERVVRGAPCPVVTVHSAIGAESRVGWTFDTMLVPLDLSDCSREVLAYALHLAERLGSALTLLHVVEPVGYGLDFTLTHAMTGAALRQEVDRAMDERLAECRRRGVRAESLVVPGVPADTIQRLAEGRGTRAIVMGTHGRRGWSHVRFGSTAESVVRHARCPVFTVRNRTRADEGAAVSSPAGESALRRAST